MQEEGCAGIDFLFVGPQGIKVRVCEPDYGPVFRSTIDTIKTTCDNFTPQG